MTHARLVPSKCASAPRNTRKASVLVYLISYKNISTNQSKVWIRMWKNWLAINLTIFSPCTDFVNWAIKDLFHSQWQEKIFFLSGDVKNVQKYWLGCEKIDLRSISPYFHPRLIYDNLKSWILTAQLKIFFMTRKKFFRSPDVQNCLKVLIRMWKIDLRSI